MKILINESRTIPINPELYSYVMQQYKNMFEAFLLAWGNHDPEQPTKDFTMLMNKGGKKFLQKIQDGGFHRSFVSRAALSDLIDYSRDTILRRKMSKKDFYKKLFDMPNSTITLAFWIGGPDDDNGYFWEHEEVTDVHNLISIRFSPFMSWEDIVPTVRHELQHFTQSFYSKVFGLDKWIGLGPKHLVKGQNPFGDDSTEHQDIPVEMQTDIQDEIHLFLEVLDDELGREFLKKHPERVKKEVLDFLNISGEHVGFKKSSIYYHYFLTNKELWKWAVKKLLTAVEAYLK